MLPGTEKGHIEVALSYFPLTPGRWDDFVALFGERGACGGCWCMLWRLTKKECEAQKGEANEFFKNESVYFKRSAGVPLPQDLGTRHWHDPAS